MKEIEGCIFKNEEEMLAFERKHLVHKWEKDFVWIRCVNGERTAFMIVIGLRSEWQPKLEKFFRCADKLYTQYKATISP